MAELPGAATNLAGSGNWSVGLGANALLHSGSSLPSRASFLTHRGAALFLASDDAAYITGDVIKVDGGMLAQQRSATVDIKPPSDFPKIEDL